MKIQRATTTAVVPLQAAQLNGATTQPAAASLPQANHAVQQQQQQQQANVTQQQETPARQSHSETSGPYLQDTRTHVVGELYDTERSYVESLQIIIEKYMKPLKNLESNKALIEASLVDEIFFTIPEILQHHENFLSALQARLSSDWDSSQVIGNLFIEAFTNQQIIDTYTAFINNWKNARHAIKMAIQAKPAFERFLEAMSREHRNKLTLDALLIMPVQRIPRYELLIKELIKHTPLDHPDHGPLIEAQRQIHELALKIDRAEREMIHQERLKDLESLIEGHVELQHPQRDFVRYDLVTISSSALSVAKKERVLFLFCDLLIITSVKKKVSRRSNLQAAYASSTSDIGLLEGNKFKLILRVCLDQVEVRHQADCATAAGLSGASNSFQQQQREHLVQERLVLDQASAGQCKRLIEDRRQELESDLFLLQQMEILSSQMTQVDGALLARNLKELNEQLRHGLQNLERQQGECDLSNSQQQQHSAQMIKDLYLIQAPVCAQMSAPLGQLGGASVGAGPGSGSHSNSQSGTPQHQAHHQHHQQVSVSLSGGGGGEQQPPAEQHAKLGAHHSSSSSGSSGAHHDSVSLEFLIRSDTAQQQLQQQQKDSNSVAACDGAAGSLNATKDSTSGGQLPLETETLTVTFNSRERRQAFLQAFLEAKQVRYNQQLQLQQQQQSRRTFTSSLTMKLQHPDHLIKSQSIASDLRRNRLRHQDEVLEMRLSTQDGDQQASATTTSTGKTQEEARNSSAPCVGTIVHQISAPLSMTCNDETHQHHHDHQHHFHHSAELNHQQSQSTSLCAPCSANIIGANTACLLSDLDSKCQQQAQHQQQHHHHQLMHQPASHPARLHTICCHDQHNDARRAAHSASSARLLNKSDQMLNFGGEPVGGDTALLCRNDRLQDESNNSIVSLSSGPILEQQQQQRDVGGISTSLILELAPRFLMSLPINFLNTRHPALQFTCSLGKQIKPPLATAIQRPPTGTGGATGDKRQTVADDRGQLWLCMSNGYVSHIALISFERTKPPQPTAAAAASQQAQQCFQIVPMIRSSGDICKSQINCAAQVASRRSIRRRNRDLASNVDANNDLDKPPVGDQSPPVGEKNNDVTMQAPKVSIKAASPPLDITAKCSSTMVARHASRASDVSRFAHQLVSRSAPSAGSGADLELENFLRSAATARASIRSSRPPTERTNKQHSGGGGGGGGGGGERRGSVIKRQSSCDNAERHRVRLVQHQHQHQPRPRSFHHASHDHLGGGGGGGGARCGRCQAHRQSAASGRQAGFQTRLYNTPNQISHHHHHHHHHHSHSHQHHNQHHHHHHHPYQMHFHHGGGGHAHQHQHGHQLHQQHHHHQHHHMYHSKHHTVPLAELRRALERQHRVLSDMDQQRAHLQPLAHPDRQRQLGAPLLPPARRPAIQRHDSMEERAPMGESIISAPPAPLANNLVRSATPPATRYLSTSEQHKSLRSARALRHQASLKTSSILAKLVGTASRGSSYLRKSSQALGSSLAAANNNQKSTDKSDDNDETDTDGGGGGGASKRDDSSSIDSNSLANQTAPATVGSTLISTGAISSPTHQRPPPPSSPNNNNLQVFASPNASLGNLMIAGSAALVSPLSSVSSLNDSSNSSLTVNSACASSPNRSRCNLMLADARLSTSTCCAFRQLAHQSHDHHHHHQAPRFSSSFNRQDSSSREEIDCGGGFGAGGGGLSGGQIRSRSATVPCRAFCEQQNDAESDAMLRQMCPVTLTECRELAAQSNLTSGQANQLECYKVSELEIGDAQEAPPAIDRCNETAATAARQEGACDEKAATATDESLPPLSTSTSLWLGCDDGSLIVIDCLADIRASKSCQQSSNGNDNDIDNDNGPSSCTICDQSNELVGCQNVHSEVKLSAPICDIKNYRDQLVFVALADGQLAVFSRSASRLDEGGQVVVDNNSEIGPKGEKGLGKHQPRVSSLTGDWSLATPQLISLAPPPQATSGGGGGGQQPPASKLCLIDDHDQCQLQQQLWFAYGRVIYVLDVEKLQLLGTIEAPTSVDGGKNQQHFNSTQSPIAVDTMELARMGGQLAGVWVAYRGCPLLQLYDISTRRPLLELNLLESINKVLSCGNEIIRQHKTACLGVSSLLSVCKPPPPPPPTPTTSHYEAEDELAGSAHHLGASSSLFVGTSAGIIIYLTVRHDQLMAARRRWLVSDTVADAGDGNANRDLDPKPLAAWWNPQVVSLRHGHSGQVKFLQLVELIDEDDDADEMGEAEIGIGQQARQDDLLAAKRQLNSASPAARTVGQLDKTTTTTRGPLRCLVSGGAGLDSYGPNSGQQQQQQQLQQVALVPHLNSDEDCLNHLILWQL